MSRPIRSATRTAELEAGSLCAAMERSHSPGREDETFSRVGITFYGCDPDESALIRRMAPHYGVVAVITDAALSESTAYLAEGNRCISVGHKTEITSSTLLVLSQKGVRYISTRSAGYNHIDVQVAAKVGISVANVAYSPDSVADYTLMLMLMVVRDAKRTLDRVFVHDYRLLDVRGRELRDMTVGVIGTGRIGSAVVNRLQGFGCRVLAYDRLSETSACYVSLDALLQQSDVVTLHIPLTHETHHLLDRQRIARMRRGAILVNTGRGALIENGALLYALESGRLGGAALDVLEGEEGLFYFDRSQAPTNDPVLSRFQLLPNVVVTPHTAYYTEHALQDAVESTLINCRQFLDQDRHG